MGAPGAAVAAVVVEGEEAAPAVGGGACCGVGCFSVCAGGGCGCASVAVVVVAVGVIVSPNAPLASASNSIATMMRCILDARCRLRTGWQQASGMVRSRSGARCGVGAADGGASQMAGTGADRTGTVSTPRWGCSAVPCVGLHSARTVSVRQAQRCARVPCMPGPSRTGGRTDERDLRTSRRCTALLAAIAVAQCAGLCAVVERAARRDGLGSGVCAVVLCSVVPSSVSVSPPLLFFHRCRTRDRTARSTRPQQHRELPEQPRPASSREQHRGATPRTTRGDRRRTKADSSPNARLITPAVTPRCVCTVCARSIRLSDRLSSQRSLLLSCERARPSASVVCVSRVEWPLVSAPSRRRHIRCIETKTLIGGDRYRPQRSAHIRPLAARRLPTEPCAPFADSRPPTLPRAAH